MFGLIGLVLVVSIICGTIIFVHERENDHLERTHNYRFNSDVENRNNVMFLNIKRDLDDFKESYFEDFKGLNRRVESVEVLDSDYKKKVDALMAKSGFGL